MSLRLPAVTVSLALLSSCAIPRTAMVVGTATAIYGGVVFAASHAEHEHNSLDLQPFVGQLLGALVVAVGFGIFSSGAIGLEHEQAEQAARRAAPVAAGDAPVLRAAATPSSATAVLLARTDQLAIQLHVEARAGHCEAAAAIARRLAVLDRARAIELIERDADIAMCVGYRM